MKSCENNVKKKISSTLIVPYTSDDANQLNLWIKLNSSVEHTMQKEKKKKRTVYKEIDENESIIKGRKIEMMAATTITTTS